MNKDELRAHVLREWARSATSKGWGSTLPEEGLLVSIAATQELPLDVDSVRRWKRTIEWLLHQVAAGALVPHTQLPEDLEGPDASPHGDARTEPSPDETGPATAVAGSRELTALREWRTRAIAQGMPGIYGLKETNLRQVVATPWRTAEEIRAAFKPVVGRFAEEIAAVLAAVGGDGEGVAAGASADASERPRAPRRAAPPIPADAALAGLDAPPAPVSAEETPIPAPLPADLPKEDAPRLGCPGTVDPSDFATYEFGPSSAPPEPLRISGVLEGAPRLLWTTAQEPGVYRLVSADAHPPFSPDQADLVGATTAAWLVDARPLTHAVRHYQVWRNDGATVEDAKMEQPVLHAAGQVVAPALQVTIREDEGHVIGRWKVLPGTQRVHVYRIPLHSAAGASGDPRFRILPDRTNLDGFVDTEAVRGEKYLYQVMTEALVNSGAQLSPPASVRVDVTAVHEAVNDLSFMLHDDERSPLFDLAWTAPPGGEVVIYRTTKPPVAGIERKPQDESVLGQAGLTVDSRLSRPLGEDKASMNKVPWPRDWSRAYFTAVVLQDGVALVGNTVRGVRVPPVERPRIAERVSAKVLTFAWPEGADVVQVYRGQTGGDPLHALEGPAMEISRTQYEEQGGFRFPSSTVEPGGGELYLVSVAFDGGQRVRAHPVTLAYPPLLRLRYQVTQRRSFAGKLSLVVQVGSDVTVDNAPPLVLLHNPGRLPLSALDGTPIAVVRNLDGEIDVLRRFVPERLGADAVSDPGWRTDQASWQVDVPHATGFVRLFVDIPSDHLRYVALLDPPIASLRLRSVRDRVQGVFGG